MPMLPLALPAPCRTLSTAAAVLLLAVALPGQEATDAAGAGVASEAAADAPAWRPLFNGEDLTGWTPKIVGHPAGENFADTFRVVDGLLTVSYDGYDSFDGRFGHLFHEDTFSNYRLRAEYRFVGEQAQGGPGWAFRNSGLMVHGQSPGSMGLRQDFPVSIEVQLLGGRETGERSTANLCTPGTNVVRDGALWRPHCLDSASRTYRGDRWVTVEVEVRGDTVRHLVEGDTVLRYSDPQLDPRDGDAKKLMPEDGDPILRAGTVSLQSESHPVQFRKVEILELGAPGPWFEPLGGETLASRCATAGNWSLRDGVATLTPSEGQRGWRRFDHYLWIADREYGDFEAEFEYLLQENGNSGFYFHVGDITSPVATGVEVQLYATPEGRKRLTDHDAGGIIPGGPPTKNAAKPAGAWNHMHVLCEAGEVRVTLNGQLVHVMPLDHPRIDDRPRSGAVGFQDHSLPLAVRNWRIRGL